MSEDKKYNGWTNYETWNVKLWMDNEEGSYNYWNEQAQEAYDNAEAEGSSTREENAVIALAGQLKEEHQEAMPELKGTFADLLSGALSEVNWHEIAENMIEDVDKEEPDEEEEDEDPGLGEQLARLSREQIGELLESASIQCYDHETTDELREALRVNIQDGTIDRSDLP